MRRNSFGTGFPQFFFLTSGHVRRVCGAVDCIILFVMSMTSDVLLQLLGNCGPVWGGGGRTERHTGKRVRWSQRAERWAAKKTKNENGKGRLFYICTKELNDFILVVRV